MSVRLIFTCQPGGEVIYDEKLYGIHHVPRRGEYFRRRGILYRVVLQPVYDYDSEKVVHITVERTE